jgi:hypothetical protein
VKQLIKLSSFILFVVLLSSCTFPFSRGVPRVEGATPEEVTQRHVPNLGQPTPSHVEIHGTRDTLHGVLVLYTAQRPRQAGPPTPPNMGYVLTTQQGDTWQVAESAYGGSLPLRGQAIDYRSGAFAGGRSNTWIVYGQVLDPDVAAVEATFDTGQVMRDTVSGEMFGLIGANVATVCEVRALDAQGNVLQQFDPAQSPAAPPDAQQRATRCPAH